MSVFEAAINHFDATHIVTKLIGWFLFASFVAIILWKGVLPSLQNSRGDFANYYSASRLVAEGKSLKNAYRDFVWFQKQIDRYGISQQLGGYIPHPPPTALVMLPLTLFEPLTAKRLWISFNIVLAALIIFLLAESTSLHWLPVAIVFLSTGFGLINNFLFGQMYLLLLASIVGGIYLQQTDHSVLAGIVIGSMIPMKYIGVLFVIYFAWKKDWRLAISSFVTTLAIIIAAILLQGTDIFKVFITEVLPRHLQGEIQDPFAIQFQSWNSLLRRLFVYNETMNPSPPFSSMSFFVVLKNLISWLWLASFILIYRITTFAETSHQKLFEIGFIPLAILLISPGGATYHFLLLSITVVCMAKILIDLKKEIHAAMLGLLFLMINLPHYLKLKKIATGWLTPLGYMRLWLLVFFFFLVCLFFHRVANWKWRPALIIKNFAFAILIAALFTMIDFQRAAARERDGAQWIPLHEKEFDRHLGLLVKTPDVGSKKLVFSYGELLDEDYAIFSSSLDGKIEGQWTPNTAQKFYDPDLALDDQRILMESVNNCRPEIWLSQGRNQSPVFLLDGENPSWHHNGMRFAFVRDGKIGVAELELQKAVEKSWLNTIENCYDISFSPIDDRLLFCATQDVDKFILGLADATTGEEIVLLQGEEFFERPTWSSDALRIIFSWNRNGNRDIWMMNLATKELQRITRDPAIDTSPAWDETNKRILFTSDRGRGLEFSTLFWIASPH